MKAKKLAALLLGLLLVCGLAIGIAACAPKDLVPPDPDTGETELPEGVEFIFTGEGTASTGRTLTFEITGNQDAEKTLLVTVQELPALRLSGTWAFVEGKGYKIYLNDASKTLKYTKYDAAEENFYFNCNVDVGSYGTVNVDFTFEDADFADEYDGVGLGMEPPIFATEGYAGGAVGFTGTLGCTEDGTFSTADTWNESRTGTWAYDEEADAYIFTFDEASTDVFYDIYLGRVEAGVWTTFTYKPWRSTEVPAENLTKEQLDELNWFRDPVVCAWDEEMGCYYGEMAVLWKLQGETTFRSEITGLRLTFAG